MGGAGRGLRDNLAMTVNVLEAMRHEAPDVWPS